MELFCVKKVYICVSFTWSVRRLVIWSCVIALLNHTKNDQLTKGANDQINSAS